ncbi:AI-2E family transporter [Microbacterium aoyamense]|uniref:AI-2E family transporter n=1 Tax=Microbacterium aoyamense TaxID=344166 RepID=A0ABP5B9R1_9MICO|nr:AI-2E family transporter [Microbacterium aoyamense]
MTESADASPAPPERARSLAAAPRRGILAIIDHPLIVAFTATIGVLGALLLGSAIAQISTILIYVFLALFIALGLDPIVRWLERKGLKRGTAITLVFLAFALVASAFLLVMLPPVLEQIGEFVASIPVAMAEIQHTDWYLSLPANAQSAIGGALDQLAALIAQPSTVAAIGGGALAVGVGIVNFITGMFIVVALTLYFLSSLTAMKDAFYSIAPARSRPRLAVMTEQITASVGESLIGSVVLSAINAAVVLLLHLFIGLPFPALMASIAFVITLIPLFGSVIFWLFATAVALFSSPTQALIFGVCYLVYIQVESYVVSPRVMNRAVSIPAALVLIGALVGGALAGVLGVLLALPIMASLLMIIREVLVPRQDLKT